MWGASNLFRRLDEYHSGGVPTSISNNSPGQLLVNSVISEFSAIISKSSDDKDMCSLFQSSNELGNYSANIRCFGEKMELKLEKNLMFLENAVGRKKSAVENLSRPTPRNRKRVQYFDESPAPPNGNDEAKKRRKAVNHSVDAIPTQPSHGRGEVAASKGGAHENDDIVLGEHVSRSPSHMLHEAKLGRPAEGRVLYNEQKSLHIHLKAEFAKLFEVRPNEGGDLGGSSEELEHWVLDPNSPNKVGDPDLPASTSKEIVSVFPLPPEEHTEVLLEDPTREHLMEVSGTGFDVVLGNDNSEVNDGTEELNIEHASLENNSHVRNDEDNPRDAVRSTDTNQVSPLELVVDLPLAAAVLCSDDGGSLPQNQVSGLCLPNLYGVCIVLLCRTSGFRNWAQSGTQVEVDAGQYGANSSEAVLLSSSEQQQPASYGFSLAAHEPPSEVRMIPVTIKGTFTPNLGSSRHLDGRPLRPYRKVVVGRECPPGASSHNIGTPVQVPGSAELPSEAVMQHITQILPLFKDPGTYRFILTIRWPLGIQLFLSMPILCIKIGKGP
ncbi:hypothetical protein HAX54_045590 [Datura stramonium]|uniref:Uncharacterized protein n=1 Tax=Datura stramonium TaxID=4076 RepID=A0ABS8WFZ8_DATST|nr:hypothetical protein [Datura stramonium]